MKKKIIIIISIIILVVIAVLSFATIAYSKTTDYKSEILPNNVTINGVDCSNLTYKEAADKLTEAWNSRHIVVTGTLGETLESFTNFGCSYKIMNQLKTIKSNYLLSSASNHYFKTPISIKIPMIISDYNEDFKQKVDSSEFLNNENSSESQNAYVDITDTDFPIVPEVYGTKPDKEKFFNDLLHHIQTGNINLVFDEKQYYSMPAITRDSKELADYQLYCKKYLKQKITYEMGDKTFTISPEQLNKMMADDLSGKANKTAVKEYVKQLANKYDNVGIDRNLTSPTGKKINVSGGTYGWEIDTEKETTQLTADINAHKNVSRKPVYSIEGYGKYSDDVGDTYIDVDITKQVVNYYKNGSLSFSSNCVTGCKATGHTTDTGTFYILNKIRHVVLRGDNGDGTRYESPVSYWMGVTWGGQGFHDATWRSTFGGNIWINNGSHGCINMPLSQIPALYNTVEVGTPVVMHY